MDVKYRVFHQFSDRKNNSYSTAFLPFFKTCCQRFQSFQIHSLEIISSKDLSTQNVCSTWIENWFLIFLKSFPQSTYLFRMYVRPVFKINFKSLRNHFLKGLICSEYIFELNRKLVEIGRKSVMNSAYLFSTFFGVKSRE